MNKHAYRNYLRDWLTEKKFDLAATYTFKKAINAAITDKFMSSFYNKIDKNLYGNAAYRYNKRLQRINICETGVRLQKSELLHQQTDGRLHVHSAIILPEDRFEQLDVFCLYMEKHWYENSHIAGSVKFEKIYSQNWLHYMTKQISAAECDTILVNSSHIA